MTRAVRMWLASIWLAMGGCFGPTYSDCAITCASSRCPTGLSCVDGYCRTANAELATRCVDAPPGDRDDDMFTDDRDNCPDLANPDQADEDKDMLGNVCDPCPAFSGVDNNDGDSDGVGNGCDPNPTIGGERILLFVGFDGAAAPVGATVTGNWLFIDGQARLSDSTLGGLQSQIVWELASTGNESVLAKVGISNLAGPLASAGVIGQLVAGEGTACQAGFDGASAQKLMLEDGTGAIVASSNANNVTLAPFLIDEKRVGLDYRCSSPVAPTRAMTTVTTPPAAPASFGLRAHDVTAHYDWVMVIASP